jgi:hypothetical protein
MPAKHSRRNIDQIVKYLTLEFRNEVGAGVLVCLVLVNRILQTG